MASIYTNDPVTIDANTKPNLAWGNQELKEKYDDIEDIIISGWIPNAGETWTYASADAPSFTITITGDKTAKYYAGMKVKLTHASVVKYFIITAVSYGAPNTTITLYGGTGYTLSAGAITSVYFSTSRAPAGFNLDPTYWTVQATWTADKTQTSPVQSTWYNLGSITMDIPSGVWRVTYKVILNPTRSGAGIISQEVALSTANNSASDNELAGAIYGAAISDLTSTVFIEKNLSPLAKTTYYLISRTIHAGLDAINFKNSQGTLILSARCVYI